MPLILYLRCAYCDIPYDVIGKMETFSEDFSFLRHISRLGEDSYPQPEILNAVLHDKDRGKRYLAMLDSKRRQDLFKLYKPDFDLFGYEAESYGVQVT